MNKEQIKKEAAIFGLVCMIGYSILILVTFLTAYLNPNYSVMVLINYYGEAHWEFVLLLTTFPFCFWAFYYIIKELFK